MSTLDFKKSPEELSDSELYTLCKDYGLQARVWRRRFAGLLPEVLQRDLHRRRGYGSLYEFAFKLAGMSSASVDKILGLADKLADKPVLREQLVSGSQGWSKIEKVAYIATPETDKEWAEKVETMTQQGLEAYVRASRGFTEIENGEDHTLKSGPGNTFRLEQWGSMSFPVSPEVEKKLRLLKYQLERDKGVTLTFNEVFQALLAQEAGGEQKAQVVIQVCPECAARKAQEATGRAIPIGVRRILEAMYHGLCGFPECTKPATSLHHTRRYSLDARHDHKSIVPLCKAHERLVHSGMVENETDPPRLWRLLNQPDPQDPKFLVDQKVQAFRKEVTIAPP